MTNRIVTYEPEPADWNCLACDGQMFNGEMEVPGDPDCDHDDKEIVSGCCGNPVDRDIGFCSCGERVL
jgi:hypothetical protein|tara:strand:- start:2068 stop:2271 length:204 start_codon:yes stop_codon:yes gene_type:complete